MLKFLVQPHKQECASSPTLAHWDDTSPSQTARKSAESTHAY